MKSLKVGDKVKFKKELPGRPDGAINYGATYLVVQAKCGLTRIALENADVESPWNTISFYWTFNEYASDYLTVCTPSKRGVSMACACDYDLYDGCPSLEGGPCETKDGLYLHVDENVTVCAPAKRGA